MVLFYDLIGLIAYFAIMICFMIIAISTAKSNGSWIAYAIGAIFQFPSLLGNQKHAAISGVNITVYWIIYFALLIVTAILMDKRRKKASASSKADEEQ